MANTLKLKRSAVPGKTPANADLVLGELAVNTFDGKLFFKTDKSGIQTVIGLSRDYNDLINTPSDFSFNIAADDSTQRTINKGETVKISGANGIGVTSDIEGNLVVSLEQSNLTVSNINSANAISNEIDNVVAMRFDSDSGFDIVDLGNGAIKIQMNSTFKTLKVAGEDDLIAEGLDTLEFVAGPGITIDTNPLANPDKQLIFGTPEKSVFMYQDGNLTVKNGTTRWYAPYALVISKIIGRLAGPGDDTIQFRVRKSNIIVATVSFLAGDIKEENNVSISMAVDDFLTVDVFNVGNSQPGYGLSVEFKYNFISATGIASSAANLAIEEKGTISLATTALTNVDSWSISAHRSAKYLVSISQGSNFQTSEILVTHNNIQAFISEYGVIETQNPLATFSVAISGGNLILRVSMVSATAADINFSKRYI